LIIANCRIEIPAVFRGIFGNFALTKIFYFFLLTFLAETLAMIRATMFEEHSIMSSEMDLQNRHSETKLSTKMTHPLKGGKFGKKKETTSSSTRVVKFI